MCVVLRGWVSVGLWVLRSLRLLFVYTKTKKNFKSYKNQEGRISNPSLLVKSFLQFTNPQKKAMSILGGKDSASVPAVVFALIPFAFVAAVTIMFFCDLALLLLLLLLLLL